MFKLGLITDEASQDLEKAAGLLAEFGGRGLEIRTVWGKDVHDLDDRDLAEVARIAADRKMKTCAIASAFGKCDFSNRAEWDWHLEILRRSIQAASVLNTRIIRSFLFWDTSQTERIWPELLERFRQPLKMAEQSGVILAMENEASTSLATAELTARFVREVNHPNVKVVWDPANEVFASAGERPYPDAYQRMAPYLVHCHVKDALRIPSTGKFECVVIGEGQAQWEDQLRALLGSGYSGYLSLETHWRPTAISEELLNRPGGAIFSESGEYASRLSLERITKLMEKVTAG